MGGKAILEAGLEALGTTKDEIKTAGGMFGDPVPFEPKNEFGTASKKIELYSTMMEEAEP